MEYEKGSWKALDIKRKKYPQGKPAYVALSGWSFRLQINYILPLYSLHSLNKLHRVNIKVLQEKCNYHTSQYQVRELIQNMLFGSCRSGAKVHWFGEGTVFWAWLSSWCAYSGNSLIHVSLIRLPQHPKSNIFWYLLKIECYTLKIDWLD